MSALVDALVKAVRAIRAAGLRRDPKDAPRATEQDWESLGRDLGRAVRKFRDGTQRRS